jgi:fumarate reductase subunit D
MARRSETPAYWAAAGALIAVVISVLSLLLPPELGGYNGWRDVHLLLHNLAAILTRIFVFALIGAALAGAWRHSRRKNR